MARASRVVVLAGVLLATLLFPAPADACSCVGGTPICETFWKTSLVFSGEVTAIENAAQADPQNPSGLFARRRVRFRVDRIFRGEASRDVEVFTGIGGGDCGFNFMKGERYLVFANRYNGRLTTGICNPTRRLAEAKELLDYVSQSFPASTGGRVFGSASFFRENERTPVQEGTVVLRGAGREWTATLDKQGNFELKDIPAGKYEIQLRGPSGWRGHQPREIEVADPRACTQADFFLVADGRVHLKLANVTIDPVKPLALELIDVDQLSSSGARPATGYRYAVAVATGDVQWEQIPPGRYVVALNVVRGASFDQPYRPLFYPGVTDVSAAKVINVGLGERVELEPFRLPDPQTRLFVRGSVVYPNARDVTGAQVALVSEDPYSRGRVMATAQSGSDGRFSLAGIAGSRYRVRVFVQGRAVVNSEPFELAPSTAPLLLVVR